MLTSNTGVPESEEAFRYLTEADWQLLMEKARKTEVAHGETILEEGETSRRIYLITRGSVHMERQRAGRTDVLARLGPGHVFGEVAFADRTGAGASVIADEPTEMEIVSGEEVDALLQSVPGFATRFYMSLAATLARRLRATSERAMR
jgi:CRP-like cAMP-binding protein